MSRIYKWLTLLLTGSFTAILLTACQSTPPPPPEPTIHQQIHQHLTGLQTYRARATVAYISNKGTNTYETTQHGRITGEYRIEVTGPEHVAGIVTSFDGQHIYQFSTQVNGKVTILARENQERSQIFLTSFIKNWLSNQERTAVAANIEDGQYTVLETTVPGNHPYLATQRLWLSNDTLLPHQMIIYDSAGTERVIVTYHNFEYNIVLENTLFSI